MARILTILVMIAASGVAAALAALATMGAIDIVLGLFGLVARSTLLIVCFVLWFLVIFSVVRKA